MRVEFWRSHETQRANGTRAQNRTSGRAFLPQRKPSPALLWRMQSRNSTRESRRRNRHKGAAVAAAQERGQDGESRRPYWLVVVTPAPAGADPGEPMRLSDPFFIGSHPLSALPADLISALCHTAEFTAAYRSVHPRLFKPRTDPSPCFHTFAFDTTNRSWVLADPSVPVHALLSSPFLSSLPPTDFEDLPLNDMLSIRTSSSPSNNP